MIIASLAMIIIGMIVPGLTDLPNLDYINAVVTGKHVSNFCGIAPTAVEQRTTDEPQGQGRRDGNTKFLLHEQPQKMISNRHRADRRDRKSVVIGLGR
ncbi:hypothetical protein QDX81_08655 [Pseudomonas sp. CW003PS]|nr:hypothetical protein QDX81_08655 [Pseudomonas sp. CW003PS]